MDKQSELENAVFEAVLVSVVKGAIEDNARFPISQGYVLCEFVNGVIDYLGGDSGRIRYQTNVHNHAYEDELCALLEETISKSKRELAPRVESALKGLTKTFVRDPGAGHERYIQTRFYECLYRIGKSIISGPNDGYFVLAPSDMRRVETEIIPSFYSKEREDILGIAKHMVKFVVEDLRYLFCRGN